MEGKTISELAIFEVNIDGFSFKHYFKVAGGTEDLADHLWNKFVQHRHSLLSLWFNLDRENQVRVVEVINLWQRDCAANYKYSGLM